MEIFLVPRYTAETERRKRATTELQHVLSQIVHCLESCCFIICICHFPNVFK